MPRPPTSTDIQSRNEEQPLHKANSSSPSTHQLMSLRQLNQSMNKLTFYSLLAIVLVLLTLGLATLQSKANLDMQWGEHNHIRISPGKVEPDK